MNAQRADKMPKLILLTFLTVLYAAAQTGISGHVTDLRGQTVHKATLQLKPVQNTPNADPSAYAVQSSEKGEFVFEGVDPGSYTLSAAKPGYLPLKFGATRGSPAARPLTLAAGKPLTDLAIALTPAAAVSGKVLDEDGDPVHAYVVISRERYEDGVRKLVDVSGTYAEADGDGRYRIPGLEAGRYYVTARAPGPEIPFAGGGYAVVNGAAFLAAPLNAAAKPAAKKSDYASTLYPNAIDESDAKPLDVTVGQELAGIDIRMRKAEVFSVRGKIDGVIPGHPADQYRIVLMTAGRTSGVMGPVPPNVGPDGSFEIAGIPPGNYDLTVAPGGLSSETPLAVQRVTVTNHDADIVFLLQAPGSISGVVKPAVSATVTLTSVGGPRLKLKSPPMKEAGTFHIADIPPGTYRMTVEGNPDGTYLKSLTIGDHEAADLTFEVAAGLAMDQVIVTLGPAGKVQGSAPAHNVIALMPDPARTDRPELYRQAVADNGGQFELTNIVPGTYRLYAWDDIEPGEWFDADFLKRYTTQSIPVNVREGASAQVSLTGIITQTPGSK